MRASVICLTVLLAASLDLSAQPTAAAQRPASAPAGHSAPLVLAGCVAEASDGQGFVLRARPATESTTTASAGTSATGTAPSGQVTGQTPTGATATETGSPTPAVGTSGASANPASSGYNRRAPETASGTVSSADTSAQTGVMVYRLAALDGVNLREHTGHTVEVRGTLAPVAEDAEAGSPAPQSPTARSHEPGAKETNAGTTGTSGRTPARVPGARQDGRAATLLVASIRHVAPNCRP